MNLSMNIRNMSNTTVKSTQLHTILLIKKRKKVTGDYQYFSKNSGACTRDQTMR